MATESVNKVIAEGIALLEKFNKELIETGQNASKLAADAQKLNQSISKNTKETKKGADTKKQLTEVEKEAVKINQQLITTTAKLENLESEQNKELAKQKKLLQDGNKELKDRTILSDKQAGTLDKLAAKNRLLTKERRSLNLETEKGKKRLQDINKELDKNNKFITENSDKFTQTKRGIGEYERALSGLPGPLNGVVQGTKAFSQSLLTLLANPIVAIITGIVAAFTALIAAFKKTQVGADKFNKIFAQGSAIFDVLIGRVAKLAGAVGKLLKGQFKAAREEARVAFTGIRTEINQAVEEAGAIEDLKISIFEDETDFIRASALRRKEIQELIFLTRDNTKSFEERRKALEKANELELKELEEAVALQERRVELAEAEVAATPENLRTREQLRAVSEAQAALDTITAQSLAKQRELLNRVNELETKRLATVKARRIERQKEIKALIDEAAKDDIVVEDTLFIDEEIKAEERQERLTEIEIDGNEKRLEELKKAIDERSKIEDDAAQRQRDLRQTTANALFDISQNKIQRELQNENLSIAEREKLEKKAALLDVARAVFGIGVQAAQSIFKIQAQAAVLLANPLTAPLAPIALAQIPKVIAGAAIQSGVITALKLPGFKDGVTNFGGGVAELAEEGRELVKEKSGKIWLAENRGLYNLNKGASVIPNAKTESMLRDENIVRGLNSVEKAIQRIPQPIFRNGKKIREKRGNYWIDYRHAKHRNN